MLKIISQTAPSEMQKSLSMLKSHIESFEDTLQVGAYSQLPGTLDMIMRETQYIDKLVGQLHSESYGEDQTYIPVKDRSVFDSNYLMDPEFHKR